MDDLRSAADARAVNRLARHLAAAAALLEDEKPEEALQFALDVKRQAPRSRHGREILGLVLYRLGRFHEAVAELRAYRRMSGDGSRDVVLADAERATGRSAGARRRLEGVLADKAAEDEDRTEALIVLAGIEADAGDLDAARATLRRGPVEPKILEAHHVRLWYALGDLAERAGDEAEARAWFESVETAAPDSTDAAARILRIGPG